MSTSLENINAFKRNMFCISITQKTMARGLLTSRCSSMMRTGAHRNEGENPGSSETKLHFLSPWQSIQSADWIHSSSTRLCCVAQQVRQFNCHHLWGKSDNFRRIYTRKWNINYICLICNEFETLRKIGLWSEVQKVPWCGGECSNVWGERYAVALLNL